MYSIVYVLTDGEKLGYYSDLVISLCSLRKRKYKGKICVLMDQDTKDILERLDRHEFEQFAVTPIIVDVPAEYSKRIKSRWIKTSMRKWVQGDFFYIDTDTVIVEDFPESISEYEIALAPDVNSSFPEMSIRVRNYHVRLLKRCGYDAWDESLLYYNSGVMWVKDTELTHRIFEGWHQKWRDYSENRGVIEDQPALNQTNRELGGVIQRLSDLYNVQVSGDPFPSRYIAHAKIIHYIHNDPESTYMLATKQIDKSNLMTPLIQQIIENPKTAFNPGTMLRKNDERETLIASNYYKFAKLLYERHRKMYEKGNKLIPAMLGLWGKLHGGWIRVKKKLHLLRE